MRRQAAQQGEVCDGGTAPGLATHGMTTPQFLIGCVVLLGVLVMVSYNRFTAQRAGVASSWSAVDVLLQRRHDLIPNLVTAVRAHARHEREVIEHVVAARQAAVAADGDPSTSPAEQARREDALTGASHELLAVAERYPELRSAGSFQRLQAQLVETEERIAAARRLYNLEVRALNRRVEAFPSNLVAAAFRFTRADYFELAGSASTPPAVGV
jgi:LemA protein